MMSSLFFLWNILSLLNASTDINLSFAEQPTTKHSITDIDSPFTDIESETEADSTNHSKMFRCQSLSIRLPSFSINSTDTDQEDNQESGNRN